MEIEAEVEESGTHKKYVSIGDIMPISRGNLFLEESKWDENVEILSKRMSKIHIEEEGKENYGKAENRGMHSYGMEEDDLDCLY